MLLRLVRPFVLGMLPDTAAAMFFVFVETVAQLCVFIHGIQPIAAATADRAASARGGAALGARRPPPSPAFFAVLLSLLIASGVVTRLLIPVEAAVSRIIWDG